MIFFLKKGHHNNKILSNHAFHTSKTSCRYQTVPETPSTTHSDYYNTRSI